ncbi:hypothetical protein H6F86_10645 [Phormidium sp. FACHB-592]|uniref:hypothetical protein n=1 Tax=Phormidium sp. FACHB-592 TaxID=2692850 RepID=UPI0016854EA8|nr:hypothetical protein [Phormidium sp. FACHB-592]MBD2074335.1 hypothetical protein [Phormidium sp. FACHB-592]
MSEYNATQSIEAAITKIRELHPQIEQLHNKLGEIIQDSHTKQPSSFNKQSSTYWKLIIYRDSLIRIQLFLEQNFNYIESMGLLAVTRYLFELTVWLKLVQKDEEYGFVYYHELIVTKSKYFTDLRKHITREVDFLRETDVEEKHLIERRIHEATVLSDSESRQESLLQLGKSVEKEIDDKASRKFSIYGEQAQINGYGFQALLVETKILPDIDQSITELEVELNQFKHTVAVSIHLSIPKRWNWKEQAKLVDIEDEYNFIYSYTSKLLHAIPVSLTTNQKNLEISEMIIFLKYIYVRLLDIIDMAEQLLLTTNASS